MSPSQPALIRAAIDRMPEGAVVVAAMDNDAEGRALAGGIETIVRATARTDLTFRADLPEAEGQDWNERLRA